ncbi:hypothetical protein H072_7437 [Dactylellina haptotyla CBS 200.50]|uniref:MARVEL domain-containing protein n=1 Tax=Dactylellina haptotyla (strain CBS 200.50) TaxID=1284197 RepID=S8BHP4_DACHA|nr:hypothetical protein H072_7437 [Dactylellina haptotyla CBS 200.50]
MSKAQTYLPRILCVSFRVMQLISAVVVTGIVGHYLDTLGKYNIKNPNGRFVYTCVVSCTSMIYSFLCLIFWRYTIFPIDMGLFVMNLVAFGTIVNWVAKMGCEKAWDVQLQFNTWLSGRPKDQCGRWAAVETFTFVSAILYLASGCMALWKIWKQSKGEAAKPGPWFRAM